MTDLPDRSDGDEARYDESRLAANCEVCGKRPGEIAQDGDWLCAVCASALEQLETETS